MQFIPLYTGMFSVFFLISQVKFIYADKVVAVSFNGGVAPSSTQTCSSADNSWIDSVFHWAPSTRNLRHLRSLGSMSNQTTILNPVDFFKDGSASRELSVVATRCKNACAGYTTGTCRALGCAGHRRALKDEPSENHERELQDDICNRVINHINNGLNNLISTNSISNSCKSLINASKRSYTCYDDTIYGQIDTIKVWNVGVATSPSVMTSFSALSLPFSTTFPPFQSHYSFCSSRKITIEAVANDCVDVVSYRLYKLPNWSQTVYTMDDNSLPFHMYGNDVSGRMNGVNLAVGDYVLDLKPNWLVGRERRFMFTVTNC